MDMEAWISMQKNSTKLILCDINIHGTSGVVMSFDCIIHTSMSRFDYVFLLHWHMPIICNHVHVVSVIIDNNIDQQLSDIDVTPCSHTCASAMFYSLNIDCTYILRGVYTHVNLRRCNVFVNINGYTPSSNPFWVGSSFILITTDVSSH